MLTRFRVFAYKVTSYFHHSIQIRGHAVTYRSAVGHTVSRDANSQARVHQGCIRNRPLYPHSLFPTLVHSYSSLEGVNENK